MQSVSWETTQFGPVHINVIDVVLLIEGMPPLISHTHVAGIVQCSLLLVVPQFHRVILPHCSSVLPCTAT